jgi:hypothetical protein
MLVKSLQSIQPHSKSQHRGSTCAATPNPHPPVHIHRKTYHAPAGAKSERNTIQNPNGGTNSAHPDAHRTHRNPLLALHSSGHVRWSSIDALLLLAGSPTLPAPGSLPILLVPPRETMRAYCLSLTPFGKESSDRNHPGSLTAYLRPLVAAGLPRVRIAGRNPARVA